jgi:hypothetical protein
MRQFFIAVPILAATMLSASLAQAAPGNGGVGNGNGNGNAHHGAPARFLVRDCQRWWPVASDTAFTGW